MLCLDGMPTAFIQIAYLLEITLNLMKIQGTLEAANSTLLLNQCVYWDKQFECIGRDRGGTAIHLSHHLDKFCPRYIQGFRFKLNLFKIQCEDQTCEEFRCCQLRSPLIPGLGMIFLFAETRSLKKC